MTAATLPSHQLPTVSIVIVNFNQAELLKKCLLSLQKVEYPKNKLEIVVVDNASSDGSRQMLSEQFPEVKLIKAQRNLGFAEGCNQGVNAASGEIIVLLNNDTEVDKNWLKPLISRLTSDAAVGAVNSKTFIHNHGEKFIQNAGNLVFKDGYGRDRGAVVTADRQQEYERDSHYWQHAVEVPAFCGVSVAIRKSVYQQLEGFDDHFFAYYEDTDLSLTMRRMGYQLWFEPDSQLLHRHATTSQEWSPFFLYHTEKNRLAVLVKHFPGTVISWELFKYVLLVKKSVLLALIGKKPWPVALTRLKVCGWIILHLFYWLRQRWQLNRVATVSLHTVWQSLY